MCRSRDKRMSLHNILWSDLFLTRAKTCFRLVALDPSPIERQRSEPVQRGPFGFATGRETTVVFTVSVDASSNS